MDIGNEVCRTCLKTDGTFTYKFFENVDPVLLSFCTSLEVWQEDIFPKSLCTVCFELLIKFSKFKYDCIQSRNRLMAVAFEKKNEIILDKTVPTVERNNNADDHEHLYVLLNSTNIINPGPLNKINKYTGHNKYENLNFLEVPVKTENDEITIYDSTDEKNVWAEHDEYNNLLETPVKKENVEIMFNPTAKRSDEAEHENNINFDDTLKMEYVISDTTKLNKTSIPKDAENQNNSILALSLQNKNKNKISVPTPEIVKNGQDVGNVLLDKCRLECCEDGDFNCDLYNAGSTTIPAMKSKNSDHSYAFYKQNNKAKGNYYKCPLCPKRFNHLERLEIHKLTHEGQKESYECKPCKKTFKTWNALKRHNDITHMTSPLVQCTMCQKVFNNPVSLRMHMYYHAHRDVMEVCDICGREMKRKSIMAHRETHKLNRKRECECEHCGKKFFNKTILGTHVQRRHMGRQYICHICSLAMTDKGSLVRHLRRHQGIKPYSCGICNKSFFTSGGKIHHERTHSGEKPFVCSVCDKAFISKNILRDHQRIHTGERPHTCAVCAACFTQRGTLIRHMKIHKFAAET